MLFTYFPLATLTIFAPLIRAVGNATVKNNCANTTVYLWSVGSAVGPAQTIAPHNQYSETYRYDQTSGGISLKMCTDPKGLYSGQPQTDFAYTLDTTTSLVWYDMSSVYGTPFLR